jgi:hypothetical protein
LVLREGIVFIYFYDVFFGKKGLNYSGSQQLSTGTVPGTVPSYLSRPTVGYQVLSLLDSMIKNNNVVCYYYYIEPPMTQLIATTVNDTVDCS